MNSIDKIDWELFKLQKEYLFKLMDNNHLTIEDVAVLDGIVNLMNSIQDDFEPEGEDEMHSSYWYPNTFTR